MQWIRVPLVLALAVVSTGCVSKHVTADRAPGVDLSELRTFYVAKYESDTRNMNDVISTALTEMGLAASTGVAPTPPSPVDVIVTYVDEWYWDITFYLLQIDIEFRDPETGAVLASGQSYRTSIARTTKKKMVAETLAAIFEAEVSEVMDSEDEAAVEEAAEEGTVEQ